MSGPLFPSVRAVLTGGLTAGTLDIAAAFVNNGLRGRSPVWVLQSVAGGWLGTGAFKGGLRTAALGLALHLCIATTAAAVYCVASTRLSLLTRQPVICGLSYGIAVYLFMYGVVLPLSAYHSKFSNQPATAMLISVMIHMFCVGLPIALCARRWSPLKGDTNER